MKKDIQTYAARCSEGDVLCVLSGEQLLADSICVLNQLGCIEYTALCMSHLLYFFFNGKSLGTIETAALAFFLAELCVACSYADLVSLLLHTGDNDMRDAVMEMQAARRLQVCLLSFFSLDPTAATPERQGGGDCTLLKCAGVCFVRTCWLCLYQHPSIPHSKSKFTYAPTIQQVLLMSRDSPTTSQQWWSHLWAGSVKWHGFLEDFMKWHCVQMGNAQVRLH